MLYFKALRQYATFEGRSARKVFWTFLLANAVILAAMIIAAQVWVSSVFLAVVFGLGMLLPTVAAGVRRLHDNGFSAVWLLLLLIPGLGALAIVVMLAWDSDPEPNRFGPSPKPNRWTSARVVTA